MVFFRSPQALGVDTEDDIYQLANFFVKTKPAHDQEPGDETLELGEPDGMVVGHEDKAGEESEEKGASESGNEKKDEEGSIALSADETGTETSSTRGQKSGESLQDR